MVEANFSEYYRTKTPLELNQELGRLIEQLPEGSLVGNLAEMIHLVQARKNSRERQIFDARRGALIPLATVTPSFAEFIGEQLTLYFGLGVEKPASIAWMVDQDGAGIFDPVRAKEFDCIGYRIMARNSLAVYSALTNMAQGFGLEGDVSDIFRGVLNAPALKEVFEKTRRWRQEFIDSYKQEP